MRFRNALTLDLPDALQSIGFVFDPTGSSGTPTADQILLRDELRHRVAAARPEHKWIDIISKIDQPSDDAASLKDRYEFLPVFNSLRVFMLTRRS